MATSSASRCSTSIASSSSTTPAATPPATRCCAGRPTRSQAACRASDVAARLGGDEFGLALPQTHQFEAAALCERLRAQIEALADVSLSWGVAEYPTHGVTAAKLLRAADAAMYASKPRLVGVERVT